MKPQVQNSFGITVFITLVLLCGCSVGRHHGVAPVTNGWRQLSSNRNVYHVQKGDTLYSIAWAFGRDYRYLARINHLEIPYVLRVGQPIFIVGSHGFRKQKTIKIKTINSNYKVNSSEKQKPKLLPKIVGASAIAGEQKLPSILKIPERGHISTQKYPQAEVGESASTAVSKEVSEIKIESTVTENRNKTAKVKVARDVPNLKVKVWHWPVRGKIVGEFHQLQGGNKGINIAGNLAAPIHASAGGKIVYSGNGLPGYGNLIIIKHNDSFLSAYAYCKKILVREGQAVKANQIIALVGHSLNGQTMLHFEIRKDGKPVSPIHYLKFNRV